MTIRFTGTKNITPNGDQFVSAPSGNINLITTATGQVFGNSEANVGNPNDVSYDPGNIFGSTFERQSGAAYFTGGVGIEKDLNVGGYIYGRLAITSSSTAIVITGTNVDSYLYPIFGDNIGENGGYIYADTESEFASGGLRYNPFTGKLLIDSISVASTETTVSPTTGAFTVTGGVGVLGDVYIGGSEYVDTLYTKFISSTEGPVSISPENQQTEIFGNLRVRGTNPIGTAPVVTNVLYVTVDGNDTNDGRAEDASRACRTIGGAIKSPYFQPGTQIIVSAGRYLENNPLKLKPYTSIKGSDIRTTFIEPINKTQDLFHLESGCYLNYMTFLNGRSGLLDGPYANDYNRGAYATAFPPVTGNDRINLFHSPYIQNCTNQSGPWLKDGTMFVPDQTVQVPLAVGMGSWEANTTTITVSIIDGGTLSIGQSINSGQQNQGFFDARTLLLANKPFLQSQVVAFVDNTFNSGSFIYNQSKCYRDTGLIIDAIGIDMLYQSESDSTFAGLQYWSQSGYTGEILNELTTTTAAISHVKDLASAIVLSASNSTLANKTTQLFNTVTDILTVGPTVWYVDGITDAIISNGIPSVDTQTIAAYNALQSNKLSIQEDTIDWITTNYPLFDYDTDICFRDVGYMIDSVSFDLLHGGNLQSIKSGIYYYSYNSNDTQIANEIPQTTAAYNFIKNIIPNIILGKSLPTTYQNSVPQVTAMTSATIYQATAIQNNIDVITNIIRNGPSVANDKTPQKLLLSENITLLNAFKILEANKGFIQAEVIAYIDQSFNTFDYNRQICYRDAGILVENMSYDMTFGGNQKSVESGLSYYRGVTSVIAGQETQTISAIDYLSSLCQQVIINNTCTVLVPPAGIPTSNQVINTALIGGAIASQSLKNLFNITSNIILNGPSAAPAIYTSPGPDSAFVSAEILMQANRAFIQEQTINWINNTFQSFPFNQIKCRRDTGLIIDSIGLDLLYPTPSFSQSTYSGLQYWNYGDYTGQISSQLIPTIDAVQYLRDLSVKVVTNVTSATDALLGVSRYSNGVQTTATNYATSVEVSNIRSHFNIILSILGGNTEKWTDYIENNGNPSTLPSVQSTVELLQANKTYIANEVVAYVNAVNPEFTYNETTCARDVGYIIDSIIFDLVHGGNRQSIQAGFSYYGFNSSTVIPNETTATVAAFTFLGSLASSVVQNQIIVPLQTKVKQVTSLPAGDGIDASVLSNAISTITNIIANGPGVAGNITPISLTITSSTTAVKSFNLLNANRAFLIEEVITYINNQYNTESFIYNKETCARDTGLIVDSVSMDLLYDSTSESIFAGLQYWNTTGYTGRIPEEITTTTNAIEYLGTLAVGYSGAAGSIVQDLFSVIIGILQNGTTGVTDLIADNRNDGIETTDINLINAVVSLQSNKTSMQNDVISYVTGTLGFTGFNTDKCRRDVGYMIDSICFDLLHGGKKQSIKSGVYYYNFSGPTAIPDEINETSAAYEFISTLIPKIVLGEIITSPFQTIESQIVELPTATISEYQLLQDKINIIVDIINKGPSLAGEKTPIGLTMSSNPNVLDAYNLLQANRSFIISEVIAFIDATFTSGTSFNYNQELCYRDTGLIVDAVSQDILLGGNQKSLEAGLSYWNQGYNYVAGQETTTTMAINYARDLALQIIANKPVIVETGTVSSQIINTFFENGDAYMPQQAVRRNFDIITGIISDGPASAPPPFAGGGLFQLTGLNGSEFIISPTITALTEISSGTYAVGLSTSTIGFGTDATLYFGDILIFPLQDAQVEELSYELTGNSSTWNSRKVDPLGSMGGSLVDGGVISDISPIQSFVYDAFTQVNQGGYGVRVTNNGYAQLVSVFTIFCSTAVQVDNGGIASITNSNCNFGDLGLVSKGYGKRSFSGTVFNPVYRAYPFSPSSTPDYLDQYYPSGYWPKNGSVEIFLPDGADRPHIGQVMEVIPPDGHINEQQFAGFLNAQPSTGTLVTGSIVLENISNTDVYIGNAVYIRDQYGYEYDNFEYKVDNFGSYIDITGTVLSDQSLSNVQINGVINPDYGKWYASTGTLVTDVGYNSITLNKALTLGGGDPTNPNFFNLYFCGNSYYTVLTSNLATPPYRVDQNILSANTDPFYQGPASDQITQHIDSINILKGLVGNVIANRIISPRAGNTATQFISGTVAGGLGSQTFLDLRFDQITNIIGAVDITAAENVVPSRSIVKSGTTPAGAGSAITLIRNNFEFLAQEITSYVQIDQSGVFAGLTQTEIDYIKSKCVRDIKIILQRLIYDLETGGNYNAVYTGLSYWGRDNTHHVVGLGEAVNRTDLFPDGATVNFYQRSYISASGYLFEYVGAGTNYGSLPQRGVKDPDQTKETVQLDSGKVFFTSTDQNGDFRIGSGLVISQATGVLSGRTFTQSLFANMTPFILAIEG